jgi:hypothetical protein
VSRSSELGFSVTVFSNIAIAFRTSSAVPISGSWVPRRGRSRLSERYASHPPDSPPQRDLKHLEHIVEYTPGRGRGNFSCFRFRELDFSAQQGVEKGREKDVVFTPEKAVQKAVQKAVVFGSDASWLRSKYGASERRVCGLMGIAVASYHYRTSRSDELLRGQLVELAREKPRFGYRRLGMRANDSGAERGRCLYTRVSGAGSGYKFRQPESDASVGCDHRSTRDSGSDSLRQRAGVHQPALSGLGGGEADRSDPYSAGQADAERADRKFSRTAAGRVFAGELVSKSIRCAAQDRRLEDGVQRETAAQQLGIPHTERVRGGADGRLLPG